MKIKVDDVHRLNDLLRLARHHAHEKGNREILFAVDMIAQVIDKWANELAAKQQIKRRRYKG